MARSYSSPLRAEQAEQTRQRLLGKLADVLADETVSEVSVADVARRAGVSTRTAYRYFPTKEDLLDAFNRDGALPIRGRSPSRPSEASELPRFAGELVDWYLTNETVLRAMSRSKPARELRSRRKADQVRVLTELVKPLTRHLDADRARAVAAMVHTVFSSKVVFELRDTWELTPEQVSYGVTWVTAALLATLEIEARKPKAPSTSRKRSP